MVVRRVRRLVSGMGNTWKSQSMQISLRREINEFRNVFKENFITLIVSAFGVVAALSWNDAIKEYILGLFPAKGLLFTKLYSALAITLISILVTYFLSKLKTQK